jgi:hypothetical protein
MDSQGIGALVGGVALATTGVVSVQQYWRNSRQQRLRWLEDLNKRFYDDKTFAEVRGWLETKQPDVLQEEIGRDIKIDEKWNYFLHFFQFLGYLKSSSQIRLEDIRMMFSYWLEKLDKAEHKAYMDKNGYGELHRLLDKVQRRRIFSRTRETMTKGGSVTKVGSA